MKNVYIIIPSYNEGETLRRTVESLLPCGYEIVVVDDGSREDPHGMLADLRRERAGVCKQTAEQASAETKKRQKAAGKDQ